MITWHCIHVIVPRETMTIPRCIMNYHIMHTSISIDIGEGLHYLDTHSTIYGIPTKYSGDFCIFKSLCIRLYLYLLFGALIQSKPFVCKHTYICLNTKGFDYIWIYIYSVLHGLCICKYIRMQICIFVIFEELWGTSMIIVIMLL